jgi:hypothetical protein
MSAAARPRGSFIPHTRATAWYVNMGPTFMFSVVRVRKCFVPPVPSLYILTALQFPGLSIIPETASSLPRNLSSKRRSFLFMELARARTVFRAKVGYRMLGVGYPGTHREETQD